MDTANLPSRTRPLVSAVIPAYNAQTTLRRALQSIAAQSYRPLEIIVVDDGSQDKTFEIAKTFCPPDVRMVVHRLGTNAGASAARNVGIDLAEGEFIAFLDADDEWTADKLEIQMSAYRQNPALAFVYSEASFLGPGGSVLGLINPNRLRPDGADAWKTLLLYPTVTTPTILTRRQLLKDVGGFDTSLTIGEDQDVWIKLALRGDVKYFSQPLSKVHDRHDSLSNLHRLKSKETTLPMILKHLDELRGRLTPSEIRRILGERYASVGRHFYDAGEVREGLRYLSRAVRHGYSLYLALRYAVSASPPLRFAKRFLRSSRDWANGQALAKFPPATGPMLMVVVDTEEEFDWSNPFETAERDTQAMSSLQLLQSIFEKHGVIPTYVVDYAVADSETGQAALRPLADGGKAVIGAHLHPWVNPPFGEAEELKNTFPGNLSFRLEYAKLAALTSKIEEALRVRPKIYRAGRYGFGRSTIKILQSLCYEIDSSILPATSLHDDGGPDFFDFTTSPCWLGDQLDIFEVPLTRGFSGALRRFGPALAPLVYGSLGTRFRLPGLFVRAGLLERGTLTPEGMTLSEMKRLTKAMLEDDNKLLCMSLHSSTVLPRRSNLYVRNEDDLIAYLERMDNYLTAFKLEFGGRFVTPMEARDLAASTRRYPVPRTAA